MSYSSKRDNKIINSFCVDMEDWFHISTNHNYSNFSRWKLAEESVVKDTNRLLEIFSKHNVKVTFLVLGWIAKQHPNLIKKISDLGHEIGCHGFYHRLVYEMTPREFELDVRVSLKLLRQITGQKVDTFRAPSFSITKGCMWAFPILSKLGIKKDISIVPGIRKNGGIENFKKFPFKLNTENGEIAIIPVSVMKLLNRNIQFSGGGFLRVFPRFIINEGFRQNHAMNRSVMSFIHPREINPNHPKIKSNMVDYFRLYAGTSSVHKKLEILFEKFKFSSVSEAYNLDNLPKYKLENNILTSV